MSKAQIDDLPYRPDPKRIHDEIDKDVKLPDQVHHAAATAEALSAGKAVPPRRPSKARSRGFQHTDAEIDQVLQDWDRGALKPDDPSFEMLIDLAREGARHIKARRRGAQQPRKASGEVVRGKPPFSRPTESSHANRRQLLREQERWPHCANPS